MARRFLNTILLTHSWSFLSAIDPCDFSMGAERAIRDHDNYPRRSGFKNIGMAHQFGIVARAQFDCLGALLMEFEVVGFHFKFMSARAFRVDTQREFVGVGRFHGDFEIEGKARDVIRHDKFHRTAR